MKLLSDPLLSYILAYTNHAYEVVMTNLNPFASTKLPQFLYDTRNPWIIENKAWLERRENPLQDLCDPNSDLHKEGIDGRIIPADLFHRLEIDNNRAGVDRVPWKNAQERLLEMQACQAALDSVGYLYVDIYISDGSFQTRYDPSDPGTELVELFADVLASMPNLQRLDWGIAKRAAPFFEDVFVKRNLSLPSVTHLVPGALSHYLITMCPKLERLEAGSVYSYPGWSDVKQGEEDPMKPLLTAAAKVPSIRTLEFVEGRHGWNGELLADVLKAMPDITSLTMRGTLDRWLSGRGYYETDELYESTPKNETHEPYLKTLMRELLPYPKMQQLHLPMASDLALNWDGGPWCGNAYMGPGGRELRRSVTRRDAEKSEEAAELVISVLPHLSSLSIGSHCAKIEHNEVDEAVLTWPWTGKMEEWLLEEVPEQTREELR